MAEKELIIELLIKKGGVEKKAAAAIMRQELKIHDLQRSLEMERRNAGYLRDQYNYAIEENGRLEDLLKNKKNTLEMLIRRHTEVQSALDEKNDEIGYRQDSFRFGLAGLFVGTVMTFILFGVFVLWGCA